MTVSRESLDVLVNDLDRSRRVAWAKYFDARRELDGIAAQVIANGDADTATASPELSGEMYLVAYLATGFAALNLVRLRALLHPDSAIVQEAERWLQAMLDMEHWQYVTEPVPVDLIDLAEGVRVGLHDAFSWVGPDDPARPSLIALYEERHGIQHMATRLAEGGLDSDENHLRLSWWRDQRGERRG